MIYKIDNYRQKPASRKTKAPRKVEDLIVAVLAVDARFISGGFENITSLERKLLDNLSRAVSNLKEQA